MKRRTIFYKKRDVTKVHIYVVGKSIVCRILVTSDMREVPTEAMQEHNLCGVCFKEAILLGILHLKAETCA